MSDVRRRRLGNVLPAALLVGALVALGPLPARPDSGGKIDSVEKKLKEPEKERPKDRDRDRDRDFRRRHRHDEDERGERATLRLNEGEGEILLTVLAAPFWVPVEILDDQPFPPTRPLRFERYPYRSEGGGWLRMGRPERGGAAPPAEGGPRFAEAVPEGDFCSFRLNYSFESDSGDLTGHRGELIVRTAARVNLDFSATDYCEKVDGRDEHLQHLQGHLTYTFAASERALFAAGAGVRSLRFEDGCDATGLDFRYEAELFPVKPLHLHFIGEIGNLHGSPASELEARAGALWRNLELFAGYRYFRVAGVDFDGPEVGVGIVF